MKIKKVLATATSTVVALGLTVAVAPAAVAGPTATTPGAYNTVNPIRVLDTRSGSGAPKMAVASKATLTFTLPVVPADSVVLEVTAVGPHAKGYLTVFPAGNPRPTASNLNFQAGQNVPNLVLTELGAGRTVSIYNGSASTVDLLADLHGYFQQGTTTGAGGTFDAMTPVRFLDTRSGLGTAAKGKVAPKSVTKIKVAGLRGVPVNATSVALNVTAVQSPGKGFITAYAGDPRPTASSLNYEPRQDRANLSLQEIGPDGTISLYNGSPYAVDLLADVSGYFVGGVGEVDGSFTPSTPDRIVDTRAFKEGFVPALSTLRLPIFEPGDPFASFIKAISINVTAAGPAASGFLTTYEGNGPLPAVSNSNFQTGHDVAGSVIVPVNDDGTISIYNGSYGNVDVIVDFTGLFFQESSLVMVTPNSKVPHAATKVTPAEVVAHVKQVLASRSGPRFSTPAVVTKK